MSKTISVTETYGGYYISPSQQPQQYALTQSRLRKMLEEAFVAGYESPVELMKQEVDRILKESYEEANKIKKPKKTSSSPSTSTATEYLDPETIWKSTIATTNELV